MANNEKIRTSDIVEIQDVKVYATSAHPIFSTVAGVTLDIVLAKIANLALTVGEKQALDATLSLPSSLNPVVLALDVPVYYKMDDFGQIRDAVPAISNLPLPVTPTGDTVLGSTTILNISSMSSVIPFQPISGAGIPLDAYIVSVLGNSATLNLPATATAVGVTLSISPVVGDLRPVLNENALYRWDGVSWTLYIHTGVLDHTMLLTPTLNADPLNQHIPLATLQTLNHNNHIHGYYFDPSNVDTISDVIYLSIIFPNGTPINFNSMGTLPGGLTVGTTYYIVNVTPTSFQVSLVPAGVPVDITSQGTNLTPTGITGEPVLPDSHFISDLPLLNQITSAGSGKIITTTERSLIPSPDMFDALQGTVGTPSAINPYVTDYDPRINTVANPYATIGITSPPCSYPGNSLTTFQTAIKGVTKFSCTISVGSPALISATNNFQNGDIVYFNTDGTLPSGLLISSYYFVANVTPTNFNVSTILAGPLVATTNAGSGNFAVGGNNWQVKALEVLPGAYSLNGNVTWSLQEDGLLIECIPAYSATITCNSLTDTLQVIPPGIGPVKIKGFVFNLTANTNSILLSRDYCTVEDCQFIGTSNNTAITVVGNYAKISRCSFSNLTTSLDVTGNFSLIDNCYFSATSINVNSLGTKVVACTFDLTFLNILVGASYTSLCDNTFTSTGTVVDAGTSTRFLSRPLADTFYRGQPLTGQKKSVGPLGSAADYRGNTEAIFITALADPLITEIEILPGTYTFASTVTLPAGKSISCTSGVFINSSSSAFSLSDDTAISNIVFNAPNAQPSILINNCTNARVYGCSFYAQSISMTASTYSMIDECIFTGVGISITGSTAVVTKNLFQVSGQALGTDATCVACKITDNKFLAGPINLQGQDFITRGNFFLAGSPDKHFLVNSVWQGNYPASGDALVLNTLDLGRYLDPYTPGCSRVAVNGFGALSYIKTANASASTMAVPFTYTVDETFNYTVKLSWTSIASFGNVRWQITVVFFDQVAKQLGTPVVQTVTSARTYISPSLENSVTATFSSYGGIATPTSFSVDVTRLPLDVLDTLPFSADLINVETTFRSV
jgi:hypothetical protein